MEKFVKFRKTELKQRYIFLAIKSQSLRTIRVKGHDQAEAAEKAKRRYPDWTVRPYSAN